MTILFAERVEKIIDSAFPDEPSMSFDSNSNNNVGGSNKNEAATNNKTKRWNGASATLVLKKKRYKHNNLNRKSRR